VMQTPIMLGDANTYNDTLNKFSCQYEHPSKNLSYAPEL